MTYGEAVMFQKSTMRMQNGVWVSDPLPAHIKLSEKEALEYYGRKLDKYWASQIVPSVIKRLGEERALAALKGRL
ncbi:hypothetical protein [Campylobacter showae]|uniref:hypothetical protein n=1 Tax=Campylobacter showae TaxID=204 RepID=UPI0028D551FE|nr:hypothetical protein [Campylobacter showae]